MSTDNEKQLKDAYVIVPLYNVSVNSNDLPISCGKWKLIDKEYFNENYSDKEMSSFGYVREDIGYPLDGYTQKYILAEYILIKEIKLFDDYKEYTEEEIKSGNGFIECTKNNSIKDREILEINLLITSFRLINKGSIRIHKVYVYGTHDMYYTKTLVSNSLDSINSYKSCINDKSCGLLDKSSIQEAIDLVPIIKKAYHKLQIPLSYFNKYFNTKDLYDKVIYLSIILESTILSDRNNELTNVLYLRGTYLFGSECGYILKTAYGIRSKIVHTGDITKSTLKEIKKTVKKDCSLSDFIKDYLEPITREILTYYLREIGKDKNLTVKKIAEKIENEMIAKLGQGSDAT